MGNLALYLYEELKYQPKDDYSKPSTLYLTVLGALEYSKDMYPPVENDWSRNIIDEACILTKMYRAEGDSLASDLEYYRFTRNGNFNHGETGIIIACFYVLAYDILSEDDRKELLSIIVTDGLTADILAGLVGKHTLSRPHDHDLADDPEAMLDYFEKGVNRMRDALSKQKKKLEQKIADKEARIKEMQVHSDDQAKAIAAMREEKEALQKSLDEANNSHAHLQSLFDSQGERIKELEILLKQAKNEARKQKSIADSRLQKPQALTEGQNAPPAQPVQTGIDAALTFDSILDYINEMGMKYDEAEPLINMLKEVMLNANPTDEQKRKLKDTEKRLRQRNLPSIHNQNSISGSNVNLGNAINSQFHSSALPPQDSSSTPSDSSSTPPDSSSTPPDS